MGGDVLDDDLPNDVEPAYEPIPLKNSAHDTCADISAIHEATAWEPQLSFEAGVLLVCASYSTSTSQCCLT